MPVSEVTGQIGGRYGKRHKERIRKAQDKVRERLDYILETVPASDFVEIVGRVGGDVVTYMVYNDGSVYAK